MNVCIGILIAALFITALFVSQMILIVCILGSVQLCCVVPLNEINTYPRVPWVLLVNLETQDHRLVINCISLTCTKQAYSSLNEP